MVNISDLDGTHYDVEVALLKGIVGVVPVAGPMLAEIVSLRVPDQRLDRVAAFLKELEKRVSDTEHKRLRDNAYYIDLLEDAIVQSTRSLSEQRNIYIATFMEKNKDIQESDFSVKKKLLQILEQLTDTDIDILNSLHDHGYRHTSYQYIARPVSISDFQGMSESEQYEYELAQSSWNSHMNALEQNKLVFARHVTVPDNPDSRNLFIDQRTGKAEIESYVILKQGEILLKSIGIYKDKSGFQKHT